MVLPNLQLEQWQSLFDVLSMAGRGGGYAAMKAFEVRSPSLPCLLPSSRIVHGLVDS
jgi:hypothetical protein